MVIKYKSKRKGNSKDLFEAVNGQNDKKESNDDHPKKKKKKKTQKRRKNMETLDHVILMLRHYGNIVRCTTQPNIREKYNPLDCENQCKHFRKLNWTTSGIRGR